MYTRPCQSQLIRLNLTNLTKCLTNLSLSKKYTFEAHDDFKILQVSDKRKQRRDFLPGIENRKELLREWDDSPYQNENEIVSMGMDAEEFNALKSDFMDVEKSYDSYQREQLIRRKAKTHNQVRKHHFREAKQPKLLTITEMYQIRLLHEQNPVDWTVEKLSESFPATPAVILKILNTHSYRTAQQMLQHDMSVKHNWFLLQGGKLVGLSPDYEQHLSTFSYREPVVRTIAEYKKFVPPPFRYVPRSTEYRSIITSYYNSVKSEKNCAGAHQITGDQSNTPALGEGRKLIGSGSESNMVRSSSTGGLRSYENNSTKGNSAKVNGGRSSAMAERGVAGLAGIFDKPMDRQTKPKVAGSVVRWFSSGISMNETGLHKAQLEETSDKFGISNVKEKSSENSEEESINMRSEDRLAHSENHEPNRNKEQCEERVLEKRDCSGDQSVQTSYDLSGSQSMVPNSNCNENRNLSDSFEKNNNQYASSLDCNENRRTSSSSETNDNDLLSSSSEMNHNELLSSSSNSDESSPINFDINRTMHSRKPAYWREMDRRREDKEKEKEMMKAELAANCDTHDGTWRRIKPHIGHSTFTPIEQEFRHQYACDADDASDTHGQDSYRRGLNGHRMDLERIRRNRAAKASSIMHDEEEDLLPEEKFGVQVRQNSHRDEIKPYELNANSRSTSSHEDLTNEEAELDRSVEKTTNHVGAKESERFKLERSRREKLNLDDHRTEEVGISAKRANIVEGIEARNEGGETRGPLSEGILLNPKSIDSDGGGGFDKNRRMYTRKPPHWDEIMRQRNREERETVAVKKIIEEDMTERSMYDGRWRRLRPRVQGEQLFQEDDRAHIESLRTRRMNTLYNADLEDSSIHEQTLPQASNSNSALEIRDLSTENSVLDTESDRKSRVRPKFDYYIEEGIDTRSDVTHFTLDKLRKGLDKMQLKESSSLDRDEEALLASYEKKKRFDQSNELTHSVDDTEDAGELRALERNHSSADTQLTSYNKRSSQSDHLFTGTVNYTGIVSQGVDITERDVQVELANHVEMKIHIPKDLYKEDAIYKVDDCFYDDQGDFLYRVPGLKNA